MNPSEPEKTSVNAAAQTIGDSPRAGSRLRELGVVLPAPPSPLGAYIETSRAGSLLFVSGTLPLVDRKLAISGRIGRDLSVSEGQGRVRQIPIPQQLKREVEDGLRRFAEIQDLLRQIGQVNRQLLEERKRR